MEDSKTDVEHGRNKASPVLATAEYINSNNETRIKSVTNRPFLMFLSTALLLAAVAIVTIPLVVVKKKENGSTTIQSEEPKPETTIPVDFPSHLRTPSPSSAPTTSASTTPEPTPLTTTAPTTMEPSKTTPNPTTAPPMTTEPTMTPTDPSPFWTLVGSALPIRSTDNYIPNVDEIDEIIPGTESLSLSGDGKLLIARFQELFIDKQEKNHWRLDYHQFVRLYSYNKTNFQWTPIVSLDGMVINGGAVVSRDGKAVALGFPTTSTIRVYRVHENDDYALTQLGDDIVYNGNEAASGFGRYLALSSDGTTLAIGIPGADVHEINDGMVRVYRYNDNAGKWNPLGQDIFGEAYADDSGSALDLSDDGTILAIGADANDGDDEGYSLRGHVRVYQLQNDKSEWLQIGNDIDGQGRYHNAGSSVVLSSSGLVVAVASAGADVGYCDNIGQVRVLEYSAGQNSWNQLGQTMRGEKCGDQFGASLAMSSSGDEVAVGSFHNDGSSSSSHDNSGLVKVYQIDRITNEWDSLGGTIRGNHGDGLGSAVALDAAGTTLVVGSSGFYIVSGNGDTSISTSGEIRTYQLSIVTD